MFRSRIEVLVGRQHYQPEERYSFDARRIPPHLLPIDRGLSRKLSSNKSYSSKPHIDKELDHDAHFAFGAMQGWRSSMEDTHKHLLELDNHHWKPWSFYTIFDGHHGSQTAINASNLLDIHLVKSLNHILFQNYDQSNRHQFHSAIKDAFFRLDYNLRSIVNDESGCVCITCLIGPENIYLIHIGDSRGIIFSIHGDVLASTEDHKPDRPSEQRRIYTAGGRISKSSTDDVLRVDSQLAMTRVLGDFSMNKNVVPPMADVIEYSRDNSAAFVALACDGIWDVMSNEELAQFVADRYRKIPLEQIISQILDECFHRRSTDNMSIYLIKL